MITEHTTILSEILNTEHFQDNHVLDLLPIGVYVCDLSGQIISYNQKAVDLWGSSPKKGEHVDQFYNWFNFYHADGRPYCGILTSADLQNELPGSNTELIMERPDQSRITIRINLILIKNKNDQPAGLVTYFDDITEQKNKNETRYRELISAIPAGVYTCDHSGKITFFNETAVALWGHRPDINDDSLNFCACYKVWLMDGTYVPPEQTPMAIALQTGQSFRNIEALVERPGGTKFYANVNIDPLFDENNNLTGAINVFQDITTIKKAEIAIRESEARYSRLIQALDTPLYTTDAEGRITLFNKAAEALWGRTPEIGKDVWCGSFRILKPDGTELPLDLCPMALCLKEQRNISAEEILIVRPDGTIRHVMPHPQPMFDEAGKLVGAINMLVDITSMKKTEKKLLESERKYKKLTASLEQKIQEKTQDLLNKNEELRQSEERYHRMVEEVEDYAIILLDKNGFILNWNKGAEKIKGYKEEEIIGKSFEVFYLPEDREKGIPKRIINEARTNGKATIEGWRLRKDGSKFWGSIVVTALHNDSGEVIGFTKVTRDLTERKIWEDQLREYSAELEFKNKELEQFAYAASHDMKEPIRKINIYGAYIRDNKANKLDSRSADYLERALNAANRMGKLIDDLLAYSRTSSTTENYTSVNMEKIINEVISEYREEITQKGISILVGKMPIIAGVSFQLKQLMFNLVGNAIKYSDPSKDATIKINSELFKPSKANDMGLSADQSYYLISVEDNGVGFEQQYAGKIFEMFQRLESKQDTKGSGIGLTICKRIVQNHKGAIKAIGKQGEGARFEIYLPKKGSIA